MGRMRTQMRTLARSAIGRAAWPRRAKPACAALIGVLLLLAGQAPVGAQATRTWVSGVGDDANPCSRTAPCKTFAGAISKTAAAGEINVLDPGGFGGVTITKSITISSESFEAGVLVSGTNAIVINAAAADIVILRGLDIEGLGTGLSGIRWLGGGIRLNVATKGSDSRKLEKLDNRQVRLAQGQTELSLQADHVQGMTAEIEEVVVRPYSFEPKDLAPCLRDEVFRGV